MRIYMHMCKYDLHTPSKIIADALHNYLLFSR